jgi:hypothetical protein
MITFSLEQWPDFKHEAAVLWPKHWEEVALHRDTIKLAVDFRAIDQVDAGGGMHICVAREAGKIVGYWVGFIHPHLHYRDSLTAYTDIYYVRQESRKDVWLFRHLLDFVEKTLSERGVEKMFIASKCHKDLSKIFERRGMTRTEVVYTKLLKRA